MFVGCTSCWRNESCSKHGEYFILGRLKVRRTVSTRCVTLNNVALKILFRLFYLDETSSYKLKKNFRVFCTTYNTYEYAQ